jgi:hypothetical protein
MTVIAYRDGILAADTLTTVETESGGARKFPCTKLYRKGKNVIGVSGETFPALLFVEWLGSGNPRPTALIEGGADFSALVLNRKGLFEYDAYCIPEEIIMRRGAHFYAIGSGAKAALGAMYQGATAMVAARIACKIDYHCGEPIEHMSL